MVAILRVAQDEVVAPAHANARPSVLLLSDTQAEAVAWSVALCEIARLETAANAAELDQALTQGSVDLVVSPWRQGLAERLAAIGVRWLHVGRGMPEALVAAIQQGYAIHHAEPHELSTKVLELTRGNRSAAARHRLVGLSVRFAGAVRPFAVIDLSNDGISFRIDGDMPVDGLIPGSRLADLEIRTHGGRALDGVCAVVRHLQPLSDAGSYAVGCAFEDRPAPVARRTAELRDRAQIAAVVGAGARRGLVVEALQGGIGVQLAGGKLALESRQLEFSEEHPFNAFDLVRGRFELDGRAYSFVTVVANAQPLTLRLPETVDESQSRGYMRFQPPAEAPVMVRIESQLKGGAQIRSVRDLSAGGFSIVIDPRSDLMPVGTRLLVTLSLDALELTSPASVRSLTRRDGALLCGIELEFDDEHDRIALADAVVRQRHQGIEDGPAGADEVLGLFRETGFLPPEWDAALQPVLPEVRRVLDTLASRPSRVFNAVVAREQGRVVGHVSGLRIYRQTFMSHHLAALPGKHSGHILNLAQTEYLGQNPDIEYGRIWFHVDNRWPARVFGGFANKIVDRSLSVTRTYGLAMVPVDRPMPPLAPRIEVMEAVGDDLSLVERYFVQNERSMLLRAEDLLKSGLRLEELDREYRKLGLQRRRRVFLAVRHGVLLGFALAEVSSPGLNLSEVLSGWRIFLTDEGRAGANDTRWALLGPVVSVYRQAGRAFARGLIAANELDDYREMGVEVENHLATAWTFHRSLYPRFCDHVTRMFAILERRLNRRR
jgi:hypothetical protein